MSVFLRRFTQPLARWGWLLLLASNAYRLVDAWSNLEFTRTRMPTLLRLLTSDLGLLGLTAIGLIIIAIAALRTPSFVPAEIPLSPPPTSPLSPQAPKGFLDFAIDAKKSVKQLNDLWIKLGTETEKIARLTQANTKRLSRKVMTPERARNITLRASKEMDNYSAFLENLLGRLKQTGAVFAESYIGYFGRITLTDVQQKEALGEVRDTIRTLLKTTKEARISTTDYRDSIRKLRETGASQDLNRASDRLIDALGGILDFVKSLEKTNREIIRTIEQKLSDEGRKG